MKRVLYFASAAVLFSAPFAFTQPPPAGAQITIVQAIKNGYNLSKLNLTQAAEKMAEADYASKPGAATEMRSYGQLFAHVANAQYGACAAAKGVPNPNQGHNLENELKTKADIVKALNDSFAFCDEAYANLSDASAMEFITQGRGQSQRGATLMNNVVHNNEMFGTAAVYMRAKGMVPPSTERAMSRGRG